MTWLQVCFSPSLIKPRFLSWINRVLTGKYCGCFYLKAQNLERRAGHVDSQPCGTASTSETLSPSLPLMVTPVSVSPPLVYTSLALSGIQCPRNCRAPIFFALQRMVKLKSSQNQFYGEGGKNQFSQVGKNFTSRLLVCYVSWINWPTEVTGSNYKNNWDLWCPFDLNIRWKLYIV